LKTNQIKATKKSQDCRYETPIPYSDEVQTLDEQLSKKVNNRGILTTFQCATSSERLFLERPNDPKLWLAKGLALEKQLLFLDAIETYSEGLSFNPFDDSLLECRGHIYITVGRYNEAIADSTTCVRINPLNWYGWYHIGLGHYFLGNFEKAVKAFEQCLVVAYPENEHNVAAIDWMYICLKHMNRNSDASKLLEKIDNNTTRSKSTYEERLFVYKGLTKPEDLLNSIKSDKTHDFFYSIYGNAIALHLYFQGDKNRAKYLFEDIISKDCCWQTFGYLSSRLELKRLFQNSN
jgi:tetratricopeptide (TPR) repeat protein